MAETNRNQCPVCLNQNFNQMKYTQNLRVIGDKVFSYDTHVATIVGNKLHVHGHWSKTTSKHVNHVADQYGLTKVDQPVNTEEVEQEATQRFKTVGNIAALAAIFADTPEQKNDWKKRMLKAGLPGLSIPEDWDTLSEEEKAKRLDAVIALSQQG